MTRQELLDSLIKDGYLKSPNVIAAFQNTDRALFVPEERKAEAYENYPLPIGGGQTISQPLTVAFMLELLDAKPGDKILEVGGGSGWQAALLGRIVEPAGKVISIERIPELAETAKKNLEAAGISAEAVRVAAGDGAKGFPEEAPFDSIIAAAAGDHIPPAWKEEAKIGGRIVAPVKDSICVLEKTGPDTFETKQFFGFSFVPLISE